MNEEWEYKTEAFLGKGAFGEVHKVYVPHLGRCFAVKILELGGNVQSIEQAPSTVKQEISLMCSLVHPHIVRLENFQFHFQSNEDLLRSLKLQQQQQHLQQQQGQMLSSSMVSELLGKRSKAFLFLEYVPGQTLSGMLAKYGPLPLAVMKRQLRQLCSALHYMHVRHIVHRDLKPANIIIHDSDGGVKLTDLGISRSVQSTLAGSETKGHVPAGTPAYMAPELLRARSYCTRTDIWALGCVALEMASARSPYHDLDNMYAILFRIAAAHKPSKPQNHPYGLEFDEFLDVCWNPDPAGRPSALDLLVKHPFLRLADGESDEFVRRTVQDSVFGSRVVRSISVTNSNPAVSPTPVCPAPVSPASSLNTVDAKASSVSSSPMAASSPVPVGSCFRVYSSKHNNTILAIGCLQGHLCRSVSYQVSATSRHFPSVLAVEKCNIRDFSAESVRFVVAALEKLALRTFSSATSFAEPQTWFTAETLCKYLPSADDRSISLLMICAPDLTARSLLDNLSWLLEPCLECFSSSLPSAHDHRSSFGAAGSSVPHRLRILLLVKDSLPRDVIRTSGISTIDFPVDSNVGDSSPDIAKFSLRLFADPVVLRSAPVASNFPLPAGSEGLSTSATSSVSTSVSSDSPRSVSSSVSSQNLTSPDGPMFVLEQTSDVHVRIRGRLDGTPVTFAAFFPPSTRIQDVSDALQQACRGTSFSSNIRVRLRSALSATSVSGFRLDDAFLSPLLKLSDILSLYTSPDAVPTVDFSIVL
eukprot:ANDGO_06303.mRNA.1 Mitogen-activated protein kinase kinase kinase A